MKIAIAGYGVEGRANYQYWRAKQPEAEITIVDQQTLSATALPQDARVISGEGAFAQLDGFDLVIRTAGLSPYKITTDGKIWSATNEFFEKCPAPIIGVTGSKGKGTTASLIAAILEADGQKVWLVGNIGVPALDVLDKVQKDDIVVYELSSFQLWDIERSPQTAVVLFIEQEHLDVHPSMEDYVAAKGNITRFQTPYDRVIYWAGNQYTEQIVAESRAERLPFPAIETAHIVDGDFWYGDQKICSTDVMRIRGDHNKTNALAAINAVWPLISSYMPIAEGLAGFHGLPHRLHYVATVDGADYYDDSIATTPSSAIAALRAFAAEQPKVLILGGSFKGSDFSELADEITRHNDVIVLLIGAEAERIKESLDAVSYTNYEVLSDQSMTLIVSAAQAKAKQGGVVLLSPSAASFGLFKNYADRGDQFVAAVQKLAQ